MSFGITNSGFNLKRLDDVEQETKDEFINSFGPQINLEGNSPLGQIKSIMDERISLLWELAQAVYDSQYPAPSEGVTLDNVASITGAIRLDATKSTVIGRIFGTLSTTVPIGFIASVIGNEDAKFETIETGDVGAGIDEVQDITFDAVPTTGAFKLRFDLQETVDINFDDDNTDIQTALNNLSNLSGVVVTGDYVSGFTISFEGADGEKDQTLLEVFDNTLAIVGPTPVVATVTETTKGFGPFVDLQMEALLAGSTQAPAGSLTVIDTPVAGINSMTNVLDADVGRDIETDADFKLRRLQTLSRVGSATLNGIRNTVLTVEGVTQASVIENTDIVVVDGRPPKSFEVFAENGDEQEIADSIFLSKPAGIETTGTITKQVADALGELHDISFSRPTNVNIWVIVNITPNTNPVEGALYPATGDAEVEQNILDFTQNFLIGQDVVVNQLFTPVNAVAGVIGIEILVGLSDPPTLSDNLDVDSTEIAKFDSTRITVNS